MFLSLGVFGRSMGPRAGVSLWAGGVSPGGLEPSSPVPLVGPHHGPPPSSSLPTLSDGGPLPACTGPSCLWVVFWARPHLGLLPRDTDWGGLSVPCTWDGRRNGAAGILTVVARCQIGRAHV